MAVLLLQLVGPMQSWGVQSRFDLRETGTEPSKSGVIGMIAAAMGRGRDAPLDDLASLRMGVRVDREGALLRDFHTVMNVPKASGAAPGTVVSDRFYLADPAFLVGLESDDVNLLKRVEDALRQPHWAPFLGRRGCPPSQPFLLPVDPLREGNLFDVLKTHPPIDPRREDEPGREVRFVLEAAPDEAVDETTALERRPDQPECYRPQRYSLRYVYQRRHPLPVVEKEGGEA